MPRNSKAMPAVMRPWRCAILAVDPGDTSGWSIWVNGKLEACGECNPHEPYATSDVIGTLYAINLYDLPMVMVRERPYSGRTIGAAWGMWDHAWASDPDVIDNRDKRRIVKVYPATWLARVCGKSNADKAQQLATARTICAMYGKSHEGLGPDEAAAIGIGRWATHAGEVGRVLGKRAMREMGLVVT